MNKKEFLDWIENHLLKSYEENNKLEELDLKGIEFLEKEKKENTHTKKALTENGRAILEVMKKEEINYPDGFKSKDIAEFLFISSRSVSGSMRKLVEEQFVEKKVGGPVIIYSLTGKDWEEETEEK